MRDRVVKGDGWAAANRRTGRAGCWRWRVASSFMTAAVALTHAHTLVDDLLGPPDRAADRAVAVLHAHAAALAWIRDTTGAYPAPAEVAARLDSVAASLRGGDNRDPAAVLGQTAVDALAAFRSTVAA